MYGVKGLGLGCLFGLLLETGDARRPTLLTIKPKFYSWCTARPIPYTLNVETTKH